MSPLAAIVLAAAAPPETAPPPRPARPAGGVARYGTLDYRLPGPVHGSALSPDGKLLAVANPDGVRLVEVPGWRPVRELPAPNPHQSVCLRPLAFSPDGKYLAYRREHGVVTVWDLSAGGPGRDIRARAEAKWRPLLAFVAGNQLALAEVERLVFFDPATGAEVRAVPAANVLAVSPDGGTYLRADRPNPKAGPETHPGEAVLGDARTGKDAARLGRVPPWQDHTHDGVAFAPDGKTLALVHGDGRTVSVRDAATGEVVATLNLPEDIYFGPGGGRSGPEARGPEVGYARDGTLYVLRRSGDVLRWDPRTGRELPGLKAGDDPLPGWPHLLSDGQTLLTPTAAGWVRVWAAGTGAERPVPGRYQGRVVVTLSADGAVAAVADAGGRVDLLDGATGAFVRTVRARGRPVRRMVFSPDGGRLAVGDAADPAAGTAEEDDGPPVTVYRVADGAAIGRIGSRTDDGPAVPLGFSRGGRVLVEAGREVSAGDPATGAKVWGHPTSNPGGAVGPDGRTVAAVDANAVVFRDAETGKETSRAVFLPRDLVEWGNVACPVGWSADGRTLAALLPGLRVLVLDVATGRERRRFDPESDADRKVRRSWVETWRAPNEGLAVGLSPDGAWAVVAGGGLTTLWQTATGARVAALPAGLGPGPSAAAFAPDGRSVVVGGDGAAERVDLVRAFAGAAVGPPAALWDRAATDPEPWAAFALVGPADGRALVRQKLPPAPPDPGLADRVKGWVADLGSDDFATREAATKELGAVAWRFGPTLSEAFRTADDPEARRRLDGLVRAAAAGPPPADRRTLRLVLAAELTATPEARELLAAWAGGAAGAVLTDGAKAALARIFVQMISPVR